jgi:hypothetical protein
MKLLAQCITCVTQAIGDGEHPPKNTISIEFIQGESLVGTCDQGHRGIVAIQEMDFEVLFDLGGMALLDGYSREAVSSFFVALERAMGFYIAVVLHDAERDRETIDALRKTIYLSERQLGAFAALYAFVEGEKAPLLPQVETTFRNDCIHNGTIPSTERAQEFAQAAMEVIEKIIETIRTKHCRGLETLIFENLQRQFSGNDNLRKYSTSVMPMVSVLHNINRGKSFVDRLALLKAHRPYRWAP